MKILGIIDTRYDSAWAQKSWHTFDSAQDSVYSKVSDLCTRSIMLGEAGALQSSRKTSILELYQMIQNNSKDFDLILYTYGDEPFLDTQICQKMIENHQRYFADFSFSEGYPQGLTPVILSQKTLSDLIDLADHTPPISRNYFFDTIKKDLNRFSIETEISPVDLRSQRIQLNYENKNNAHICNNFLQHGALDTQSILKTAQEHPEFLWAFPTYYTLQIINSYPQKCVYSPSSAAQEAGKKQTISLSQLDKLLLEMKELSDQATVCLSYMGETSLHPEIGAMMKKVLDTDGFHLHIETSGIGWKNADWQIFKNLDKTRTSLIIALDTHIASTYQKIRGEGFEEAMQFAQHAIEEFGSNTWIQSTRQASLEAEMEGFYRTFKEKGAQVIIQKYNSYCGLLPNQKSVNIAPLERQVCWAIKREIAILSDGTVPLCQSDARTNICLGNAFETPLSEIWSQMNKYRLEHAKKNYAKICRMCDEYYIFNF
ncbi:MAG: spiro-SPASM protein [Spirochaetia bacterium]